MSNSFNQEPEKISEIIARIKTKAQEVQGSGLNLNRESTTESRLSKAETINQALIRFGISDDCIESAPKWKEKAKELSLYMDQKQKGLFMFGPQGRRKTTCATAILIYELERFLDKQSPYRSVQFIFIPDLLIQMQSCFVKDSGKQVADIIERVSNYDFLIFDGMGEGGKQTDFVKGSLGTIIHHRDAQKKKKRTLVTSNFTLQELGELLDGRISSRIAGMCEDYEFTGDDYRLKS